METTYRDALRQAIIDEMNANPDVIVMGEEVGRYGGAYGVTKGLYEMFGAGRLIDTPISEPAIIGAAIGAAMTGLRPIAELMYVDFAGLTMDQIGNQAAKSRYMFGGQIGVPLVVRMPGGTGRSGAAQHSQSLEAWFAHMPGLRVAMPATINDAYHLLRMAMRQPDPVIFIEHKGLYVKKGEMDPARPDGGWGESVVRRVGKDLTIVAYSKMVFEALDAASALAAQGIEAEVIDIRTLNPLDDATLFTSVAKTGRAMVISEAPLTGGFAAELSARISERCFEWLEEPVLRISGEDIPIPVSPALEKGSVPNAKLIEETALWLVARARPAWAV